jgi:hypothetical protein
MSANDDTNREARAALVAQLRSLAEYYNTRPDHPLPASIHLYHVLADNDAVAAYAERYREEGARPLYGNHRVQTDRQFGQAWPTPTSMIFVSPIDNWWSV